MEERISKPPRTCGQTEPALNYPEMGGVMSDENQRDDDVLVHFEGLSNNEVVLVLGLSKTAASNRYIRALGRLKAMLTGIPGILDA